MGAIVVRFLAGSGRRWWNGVRMLLVCGAAATLVGCAWLDAKQRELVFRPTPGQPSGFTGLRPGDLAFTLDVPGAKPGSTERLHLWWLPHADPQAPALLYLHGTFRNLYKNLPKIDALREAGFAVLAVDYRGWGDSTPIIPSEATIYADANVAWAELVRHQADPRKRVIFGHSMGSGVAVELASHLHVDHDYAALILESSFTRLPDVAKAVGILGTIASWFATQEFDSESKIGKVDAPILMLHGTADHTVPIELGRRLFDAAPKGTRWVQFEGGSHSGLDRESPQQYQQALHLLIEQIRSSPSPGAHP
ncbi:MAG: alpha/beta fold hydrolase [Burkholderiales bacterium]